MATYVYQHRACGKMREVEAPMGEAPATVLCSRCYKQNRDDVEMTRKFVPLGTVIRPPGFRLKPGDVTSIPGLAFDDFRYEMERGYFRTPEPGDTNRFSAPTESALEEPEFPEIPEKQMREIVQMGEILDREIKNSDWVHEGWAHYDREG